MNNGALNIHVYFLGTYVFILGVRYTEVELLGPIGSLCLTFGETDTVSNLAVLYHNPNSAISELQAPLFTYTCLLDYSHPSDCEVVTHCDADFNCLSD